MRQAVCDICGRMSYDLKPDGWGTFRVSFRWDRKIGSNLFTLDICNECTRGYDHKGAQELAIEVLKGLKK